MIINPNASVRVEIVAQSIPVLYIEDFYLDPEAVREEGLRGAFDQTVAYYPGRHTQIQTPQGEAVKRHVCSVLTAIGDRIYDAETTYTDFSILTTRARDLLGKQKHPHIDPTPVLGIVYLNPGSAAGTCLFYNRVLGMHTVVGEAAGARLTRFLDEQGPLYEPDDYDLSGNACWQKIHTIEGRYNRLVVYPGNVFHSIDVKDVPDVFDINSARLTQRLIVHRTAPKPVPA